MNEPSRAGTPAGGPHQHPHPPDWTRSDSVLEAEIEQEEHGIRTNRLLVALALALIALVIAALVLSIVALNRDIEAVAKADPKTDSVGTSAIKNGAVTGAKLAGRAVGEAAIANGAVGEAAIANGAVGEAAIASGAVGRDKLAAGAVDATKVANDALTGAQINEASIARVPRAALAGTADNAVKLGGLAAGAYLSSVKVAQATTQWTSATLQGPVVASCPSGTRVIGGGAEIQGSRNVALIESTPSGTSGWTAIAALQTGSASAWRLIVTAICVS